MVIARHIIEKRLADREKQGAKSGGERGGVGVGVGKITRSGVGTTYCKGHKGSECSILVNGAEPRALGQVVRDVRPRARAPAAARARSRRGGASSHCGMRTTRTSGSTRLMS